MRAYGGESFASLTSEERLTLWRFDGVALEVDAQALPLHVYLMGGSMKRLAIYPRSGCIKIPGTRCISLSDEENGHELVIHRAPKDYIYP